MATADNSPVSGLYNGSWASLHEFDIPYQIQNQLYQRYGQGQLAIDIIRRMGHTFNFKGTPFNAHEQGKMYTTITTFGASTGGATAGAAITFELAEESVDANANTFARVGFGFLHKHTDNKVYELVITGIAASSGSVSSSVFSTKTITASPLDSTLVVGAGGIADGTQLTISASAKAADTAAVTGTTTGTYRRQFYDRISKESKTLVGYEMGKERFSDKLIGGVQSLYSEAYAHEEFLMDVQEELGSFIGQYNSNSVTETNIAGSAANLKSAKGYWKWMDELAGKVTYGTGDFDIFTFDQVPEYLRTQHVNSSMAWLAVGPKLYTKMEQAGYKFVKEYSGGTDFTKIVNTAFAGDEERMLGTNFSIFTKNGMTFYVTVLDSFGNPDQLGNPSLDFQNIGFIIPMGNGIIDPKTNKKLPNVGLGYNVYGDVNRRRVIAPLGGMTGKAGVPILSANDRMSIEMLSHYMPFMMGVNQTVQLVPYDTYTA